LAEVSQALAEATQSLEAVLGLVARRAVALIGDGGALFLASDDEAWLQPVAFDHRDPEGVLALRAMFTSKPYRVTDDDAISQVFRTGRPALLADLTPAQFEETKPEYGDFFERFPVHSLLAVPLRARGFGGRAGQQKAQFPGSPTMIFTYVLGRARANVTAS
jgi:GAF domain-containing protein